KIGTGVDPKLLTILGVEVNPRTNQIRSLTIALDTVDGSNGCSKPLTGGDDRVNIIHPKPKCGFKGDDRVVSYGFRRVETVKSDAFARWPVVIVP
ncbi:hypothetical protein LNV47_25140, partial [Paucibacter sp. DJ4R-1]|nr:hypothetical protein [Paucibacter sp. DJ4R-1]